ncbi:LOW QUALITY PROTEIN: hypothetical protein U9M48_044828 [Paspalum notatum var. saurae]|uniref:Diacylglycerol O-acyltransferase n=1 Tax=Paspalum notatum var. saurae TaxID=547442 RepID=A0AAQ3XJW1_PASNO
MDPASTADPITRTLRKRPVYSIDTLRGGGDREPARRPPPAEERAGEREQEEGSMAAPAPVETEARGVVEEEEEAGVPMSPAGRLFRETHFNCHIVAVIGLGKAVDIAAARAGLEATLVRHPRFSSVQDTDRHHEGFRLGYMASDASAHHRPPVPKPYVGEYGAFRHLLFRCGPINPFSRAPSEEREADGRPAEGVDEMLPLARRSPAVKDDVKKNSKPRWVRTTVNLDDHIIIPDLDPTATSAKPDQAIEDYLSSLSTASMDHSRPLWELHILNFPTSEAASTVLLRMHHSLGDGISLLSLLIACTRSAADPARLPELPPAPRRGGPVHTHPRPPLSAGFLPLVLWVWFYVLLVWHTLVDILGFIATALFLRDARTPFLAASEGVEFRRKRFVHRTLSLDDVKFIKNAVKCTVNDVLVGVTNAGLSRYYFRKTSDTNGKRKKPHENIGVRSALLVNIRKTPGLHALAEMMDSSKNNGAKWGNLIGYIILPFHIAMHDDPLEYIRQGKKTAERKKTSLEAVFTYWSGNLIVKLFGMKAAATLCYGMFRNTTLSFSSIMGPAEKVEFYGHPIVYIAPSVYGHPHALTVHYQSYMNTITVVLAVDDAQFPDCHQLLDDFAESLKLIRSFSKMTERNKSNVEGDVKKSRKLRWVRTTVNLDDHMIFPYLDPAATSAKPDQAMEDYLSSLSTAPMDHSRPLWELHFLDFPTPKAASTVLVRMHHSLGDCILLMSLLRAASTCGSMARSTRVNSYASIAGKRRVGEGQPASYFIHRWSWPYRVHPQRGTPNTPTRAAAYAAQGGPRARPPMPAALGGLPSARAVALFLRDARTPLAATEGVEFRRKRFVHRSLSLDDVKFVKNAMDCALAEMLNSSKNNGAKWGNLIGYIILPFHISMHDDPLEYIRQGKKAAERKKTSFESVFSYWSGNLIVKLFGMKAAAALFYGTLRNTTMSFSSMVGPAEKVEFYGHPIVYIATSVYGHPHALTVHYQSYVNSVTLVLAVDDAQFPDCHQLLDDFAESLRLIQMIRREEAAIRSPRAGHRYCTGPEERASEREQEEGGLMAAPAPVAVETRDVEEEAAGVPMSTMGRMFREPRFDIYIVAVLGLGKAVDVAAMRAGLEATLARHPRFSSVPVEGDVKKSSEPRWVRTTVNLDDHMIFPYLDPAATSTKPDKAMEDYLSSLSTMPMEHSCPLWELHFLDFPTSEAASTVLLRVHHSLGDGTSLLSLLIACTRSAADPARLPELPPGRPRARPPTLAALGGLHGARAVGVVLRRARVATPLFLRDTRTPFMASSEGGECRRKRFVHRTLSLDDIKFIKNAMKCTVNDVLLGVTNAGLSRYYFRKIGDTNDKRKKPQNNVGVRSILFVNIRKTPGLHALAEMMDSSKNNGAKWGNLVGYIILPFHIALHDDPLEYVRQGKKTTERKKTSLEAVFTYWSGNLIVKLFGIKAAAALGYVMFRNTTMSFTSMVGPVEKVEIYGHPIVYIAPSAYGNPHALTVHYQSYMNAITLVLAVDDAQFPDCHQLLDDFAESLKLILANKHKQISDSYTSGTCSGYLIGDSTVLQIFTRDAAHKL